MASASGRDGCDKLALHDARETESARKHTMALCVSVCVRACLSVTLCMCVSQRAREMGEEGRLHDIMCNDPLDGGGCSSAVCLV